MTLFTGKGDNGTTKMFGCDQRISKSSAIAEALGVLDEINSFLGLCKVKAGELKLKSDKEFDIKDIINSIQQNLFIVQAELAGASKEISKEKVKKAEDIINDIEKILPPIKSFFISGGVEISSLLDVARTIARRAERRVVAVQEEKIVEVSVDTLAYLNRLSSLLYALARLVSHLSGIKEESPNYE